MLRNESFFKGLIGITFLLVCSYAMETHGATKVPKLNTDCQERSAPIPYKFCLFRSEGSRNNDVVYFFHGLGLDEKTWSNENDFAYLIRQNWEEKSSSAPTIVSISFGPLWLLVEKNKLPDSGLLDIMTKLIIPEIEQILSAHNGKRVLLGTSMGGFNAAQLLFKYPDFFHKVALVCPAFSSLSPFASEVEVKEFIARTHSNPEQVHKAIELSRYFIPSDEIWANTSPLKLAQSRKNESLAQIYLTGSLQDDYGFYEGTRLFYEAVQNSDTKIQWRPLSGAHCSIDIISLAEFLVSNDSE